MLIESYGGGGLEPVKSKLKIKFPDDVALTGIGSAFTGAAIARTTVRTTAKRNRRLLVASLACMAVALDGLWRTTCERKKRARL
jgi:hypothetical protein